MVPAPRYALVAVVVLTALGGSVARAGSAPTTLMPGVTASDQVEFTPFGPVSIHVVTAPRPGGLLTLGPLLPGGAVGGRATLTQIEQSASPSSTLVGLAARPGFVLANGLLGHEPDPDRTSIGVSADGTLAAARLQLTLFWRGTGPRRQFGAVNSAPGTASFILYTPAYGPVTPPDRGALEAVLDQLPGARPDVDLQGTVVALAADGGVAIPPAGAVLVAHGTQANGWLGDEAAPGTALTLRLALEPAWTAAAIGDGVAGGPLLVRNGRPIFAAGENFAADDLAALQPRTAVGQLADGRIVLVAVDGGPRAMSVGISNSQLALLLARLGAVTAVGVGSGPTASLAYAGTLLSRSSVAGGEQPVRAALALGYSGVVTLPPGESVLSPNGDGSGDLQRLAFKLVRPATVSVQLLGPDGTTVTLAEGARLPATYTFTWDGTLAGDRSAPEGLWQLVAHATDDLGQSSADTRSFLLDDTLAFLAVPSIVYRAPLTGTYHLLHPARLTVSVETRTGGVIVRRDAGLRPSGTGRINWNGRTSTGIGVPNGVYVLRVTATNAIGRSDLARTFVLRR